jgi:hypothetical protein
MSPGDPCWPADAPEEESMLKEVSRMTNPMSAGTLSEIEDNGGRRSGLHRRRFTYTDHIPERRSLQERRSGLDRRADAGSRTAAEKRAAFGRTHRPA